MASCGIPGCTKTAEHWTPLCMDHFVDGYSEDYERYWQYREDGMSSRAAAVKAGLTDPDH